jgi:hypothetical protein
MTAKREGAGSIAFGSKETRADVNAGGESRHPRHLRAASISHLL